MSTVNEMFESYLKAGYPGIILHPLQIQELRRAFYAGVWGGLNQPDDESWLTVYGECEEFKRQVLEGKK